MVKAIGFGTVLTGLVALVIGSQGTSAGPLAVHPLEVGDVRMFWSWPLFCASSGLAWALMLLQR